MSSVTAIFMSRNSSRRYNEHPVGADRSSRWAPRCSPLPDELKSVFSVFVGVGSTRARIPMAVSDTWALLDMYGSSHPTPSHLIPSAPDLRGGEDGACANGRHPWLQTLFEPYWDNVFIHKSTCVQIFDSMSATCLPLSSPMQLVSLGL